MSRNPKRKRGNQPFTDSFGLISQIDRDLKKQTSNSMKKPSEGIRKSVTTVTTTFASPLTPCVVTRQRA